MKSLKLNNVNLVIIISVLLFIAFLFMSTNKFRDPLVVSYINLVTRISDYDLRMKMAKPIRYGSQNIFLRPVLITYYDSFHTLNKHSDSIIPDIVDELSTNTSNHLIDLIINYSTDKDYRVRYSAVSVLGKSENQRAITPLINIASKDNILEIRVNAIEALGNYNDIDVLNFLSKKCLTSKDYHVRGEAILKLGDYNNPKFRKLILNTIKNDRSIYVRLRAIIALSNVGLPEDIKYLEKFKNTSARQQVEATILRIKTRHGIR